jgi:hypothetical protein
MAYTETFTCDICGDTKHEGAQWFLSWADCLRAVNDTTQPLIKITRWDIEHAHIPGALHLCGSRCAGTMMDRWMAEQHEHPNSPCAS